MSAKAVRRWECHLDGDRHRPSNPRARYLRGCSDCGHEVTTSRSEDAWYTCPSCGHHHMKTLTAHKATQRSPLVTVLVLTAAAMLAATLFALIIDTIAALDPAEPEPGPTTTTTVAPAPDVVRHLCAALDETGSDSTDQVVLDTCRAAGP